MDDRYEILNGLLVDIFNDILKIEQTAIGRDEFSDLSITEMHTIEVIGPGNGRTMTDIAKSLKITLGTLTVNIERLVKKGYAERKRTEEDRRIVIVSLTKKGILAYKIHERFHSTLIREIMDVLDDNEEKIMIKALEKVNETLKSKYPRG